MKHAENLFAQAVNQLIEIGEKARKEREDGNARRAIAKRSALSVRRNAHAQSN